MPTNGSDIAIRSEVVQDILTKVPHVLIRWGNLLILLFIIMILAFSWWIRYPDVIEAQSIITTSLPPEKVYARTSGKIDAILVANKQQVYPGQVLAVIENTASYKDVLVLKAYLDSMNLKGSEIRFPLDDILLLNLGEIESSFSIFENSYLQYRINKDLQPFSSEALTNQLTLSELKSRLMTLQRQKELSFSELRYKKKELNRSELLFEQKVISEQDLDRVKQSYLQAERAYESLPISISQLQESIAAAKQNAKSTEINSFEKNLMVKRALIQSYNKLREHIADWELRYLLKASIHGQVAFNEKWYEHQTVNSGESVLTIIPTQHSSFVAKLQTPGRNSGKIKAGQRVNIGLDSYPEEEFGVLSGSVSSISEIPNEDGLYLVEVKIPQDLVTSYEKPLEFRQEMSGEAEIITDDLRLIERFFNRLKAFSLK